MRSRPRWIRIGDWLSAGLNVIVFNGATDESTSGRSYRQGTLEGHPFWAHMQRFIDWLFTWREKDHCRKAHDRDLQRARERLPKCSEL